MTIQVVNQATPKAKPNVNPVIVESKTGGNIAVVYENKGNAEVYDYRSPGTGIDNRSFSTANMISPLSTTSYRKQEEKIVSVEEPREASFGVGGEKVEVKGNIDLGLTGDLMSFYKQEYENAKQKLHDVSS